MREHLVESYRQSYRRNGVELTQQQLERIVVADCELVDAAERAGELRGGGTPDPTPGPIRPNLIAQAEADNHKRLTLSEADRLATAIPVRPAVMHRNPMLVSERWGAACARIARIIEGVARASTFTAAVDGAELPTLARRYAEVWSYFLTRAKPPPVRGVDHNPFRGLSDRDASRKVMRLVEDICDASTGVLGSWYVK